MRNIQEVQVGPIKVGTWVCPSGNTVDVTFERDAGGLVHIWYAWDEPPPLGFTDLVYYLKVIRPEVVRRIQEYRGQPCPMLVVDTCDRSAAEPALGILTYVAGERNATMNRMRRRKA